METLKPLAQRQSSTHERVESGGDSLTDPAMIDFASVLDDFLDEEVVDKQGTAVGTLACYWKSASGLLLFLGIKVKGQESVRVVPGRRSQVDNRNTCIRLGFEAEDIESAPQFDCAIELDEPFERDVYEHFNIGEDEHYETP